jgi:hypothetical protein
LAIELAALGCVAGRVGAAQLTTRGFTDGALIVNQFRARRPLTIRTLLTSSIPVAGVGVEDRATDGKGLLANG